MTTTFYSDSASFRTLLLKRPREAWRSQDIVQRQWQGLGYTEEPNFARAVEEYEKLCGLLHRYVPEIRFLPEDDRTGLDSLYVRDAAVATEKGLILCNMGKKQRKGEPDALADFCKEAGIAVLGRIRPPGTVEGGDVVRLDERTLLVGNGYRTNCEGIRQLRELTRGFIAEVREVPLPHWNGPGDVLHLMSVMSPVAPRILLVYSRLLSVPFRNWLVASGYELLDIPDAEFPTMGCNVLTLTPGTCLALEDNPATNRILNDVGLEVLTFSGREISHKGAGGPTCLTRPLSSP